MTPKDEFLSQSQQQNDKITFALHANGHVSHIVKRVDASLYDVFLRLQGMRCTSLPVIFDLILQADCLEVHEEYIRGRTVESIQEEQGTLHDDVLLAIALDVCRALVCIHAANPPIVHRDIKPQNILERDSGGYVLIDFDAARIYREDAEADTKCIATVGYAAPEQYGLSQTDVRSDLFSLGVTLYELKTGEAYHVGATSGGKLGRIIAKCTAFEPNKRFSSAKQLLKHLEALLPETRRKRRQKRSVITAVACVLAALVFAAGWLGGRNSALHTLAQHAKIPVSAQAEPPAGSDGGAIPVETGPACTCQFLSATLLPSDGLVLPFTGAAIQTQLVLEDVVFDQKPCNAISHIGTATLAGCQIQNMSMGGSATITEDGLLTITAEGAYIVDALVRYGEELDGPVECAVIAVSKPEAYQQCACVINREQTKPVFPYSNALPEDGSLLYLDMAYAPVYDSRLCTAAAHKTMWQLQGYIESAPEGANCGVTEDNRFYTDTPGIYELRMPIVFNGEHILYGCQMEVTGTKGGA
ncbi:MAG: serine/threonine-protein kinase [Eubacteriales bacterium]|nr:serine/threonine-protein kinase [Eubacteriales bacterium]